MANTATSAMPRAQTWPNSRPGTAGSPSLRPLLCEPLPFRAPAPASPLGLPTTSPNGRPRLSEPRSPRHPCAILPSGGRRQCRTQRALVRLRLTLRDQGACPERPFIFWSFVHPIQPIATIASALALFILYRSNRGADLRLMDGSRLASRRASLDCAATALAHDFLVKLCSIVIYLAQSSPPSRRRAEDRGCLLRTPPEAAAALEARRRLRLAPYARHSFTHRGALDESRCTCWGPRSGVSSTAGISLGYNCHGSHSAVDYRGTEGLRAACYVIACVLCVMIW